MATAATKPKTLAQRGQQQQPTTADVHLVQVHNYRHDEQWHAQRAFRDLTDARCWVENHPGETAFGYRIVAVPCGGILAVLLGGASDE